MPTRARLTDTGFDKPLVIESFDVPTPSDGELLVRVEACGVCHRDLIDRGGRSWLQLPITPGHEVCGRIIGIGPGVRDWKVGDRVGTLHRDHCGACPACNRGETSLCPSGIWVYGLLADGGYATHLVARPDSVFRLPDDAPPEDLCSLHCTAGTAWRGLVVQGQLEAGQSVLVVGANGGVGAAAIQVATRLGAYVTAQVRDPTREPFVRSSVQTQ